VQRLRGRRRDHPRRRQQHDRRGLHQGAGIDKQRGTHPATGNKQAINTYVRFATSEEMEQRDFQTTTLAVDVHTRTAEGDPCRQ
jgi:hypothetical protein